MTYKPANAPQTVDPAIARYLSDELSRIATALSGNAKAGFVQLSRVTPLPIADLGAAFTPIDNYVNRFARPVAADGDAGTGIITVLERGVWLMNFTVTISHNEAQAGRFIRARIVDVQGGGASRELAFFTGRNTVGTVMVASVLVDVQQDAAGQLYRVEIGGGDVYTSVQLETAIFGVNRVSA